ncbi:MAG: sensor domain-containing diguanylate cyclase [Desulfovibrionaceae bacterium]
MDRITNEFYEKILNSLDEGVYCLSPRHEITFWNKGAERITGFTADEVMRRSCSDNLLRHVDDRGVELCTHSCPLSATLKDGLTREAHVYLHHKQGHRVPVSIRATPLREGDKIVGVVEVFHQTASRFDTIQDMERLRQEVLTDPLTGIGNRRLGEMELSRRLNDFTTYGLPFGLLFLDVDHFKRVNDTFGHAEGDHVLGMVAKTISAALRPLDIVCRWGGEEFLIILPNMDIETLGNTAERLRMLVERSGLEMPDGRYLRVTVSVGGVISTPKDCSDKLLKRVDEAMYLCKHNGRNQVRIKTR